MAWRLIMRRCPTRSMTIVGDIAQTGDLAGAASWQDALGPVRGEAVQARAAHRQLPDPRGDRRGGRRRPRRDRPDAGRRRGRCGRRACRRGRCWPTGRRRRLADAVAAVLADEAAGLGDRDADDAGDVPAGRGRGAGPHRPGGRAARAGAPGRRGRRPGEPDLDAPVVVLPVSAAKGLEFDAVVLVEPAELVAESPRGLNDLYVALTRATQRLTVVHRAPLPAVLHRPGGVAPSSGVVALSGRAAATRAATSRTSAASSSGCHWTPTTNGRAGSSRPAPPPRPCRRRPSPSRPGSARAVDRLVVVAAHPHVRPDGGPDAPGRVEPDVDVGELARCRVVPVVADDVGQVLVQRAAERDVEQLRAAADPEHRQVRAPARGRGPPARPCPGPGGRRRRRGAGRRRSGRERRRGRR